MVSLYADFAYCGMILAEGLGVFVEMFWIVSVIYG